MVLSVLIVDDERWMRDTIEKSIHWERYGLRVAGKANDGLKAYDMILELKPDIVLTDIKMPGMDGISLLCRIKETGMDPVFIFFSGFDKFEYARDAINLGALGYVLKPVDERELLKMLMKAKEKIESESQKREAKVQLANLSERDMERKKSQFIQFLLEGTRFEQSGDEIIENEFVSNIFMAAVLEIDGYPKLLKDDAENAAMMRLGLYNLCMDYFEETGMKVFFAYSVKGVKLLINVHDEYKDQEFEKVYELFSRIIDTIRKNYHGSITVGTGLEVYGKERIPDSYSSAVKALEYKLFAGIGLVLRYCDIYESKINKIILDNKMENEIIKSFEKCDFTLSYRITESIRGLKENSRLSVEDIRIFSLSLVELIYRILNKSGLQTESYNRNPRMIYDEMNKSEDMEELFRRYSAFVNENLQLYADHSQNYFNKVAESVKRYIHEHYGENISLESVAQELSFHPNYISRIFKESYGENFIDYLTNYRIEASKELLYEDIRRNISDIAGMVGYNNPKYFSKVFKKVVGITPAEFIGKNK